MKYLSKVPAFEGFCEPVWMSSKIIYIGFCPCKSGFFKLYKKYWFWPWPIASGDKFHGIIKSCMDSTYIVESFH